MQQNISHKHGKFSYEKLTYLSSLWGLWPFLCLEWLRDRIVKLEHYFLIHCKFHIGGCCNNNFFRKLNVPHMVLSCRSDGV